MRIFVQIHAKIKNKCLQYKSEAIEDNLFELQTNIYI